MCKKATTFTDNFINRCDAGYLFRHASNEITCSEVIAEQLVISKVTLLMIDYNTIMYNKL